MRLARFWNSTPSCCLDCSICCCCSAKCFSFSESVVFNSVNSCESAVNFSCVFCWSCSFLSRFSWACCNWPCKLSACADAIPKRSFNAVICPPIWSWRSCSSSNSFSKYWIFSSRSLRRVCKPSAWVCALTACCSNWFLTALKASKRSANWL